MRKLRLKLEGRTKLVTVNKKVMKREASREKKALAAAKLETRIESELLERLKSGAYGDIYNFPAVQFESALDQASVDEKEGGKEKAVHETEEEDEEIDFNDEETELNFDGNATFVAESDDEDDEDFDFEYDDGKVGDSNSDVESEADGALFSSLDFTLLAS